MRTTPRLTTPPSAFFYNSIQKVKRSCVRRVTSATLEHRLPNKSAPTDTSVDRVLLRKHNFSTNVPLVTTVPLARLTLRVLSSRVKLASSVRRELDKCSHRCPTGTSSPSSAQSVDECSADLITFWRVMPVSFDLIEKAYYKAINATGRQPDARYSGSREPNRCRSRSIADRYDEHFQSKRSKRKRDRTHRPI